MSTPVTYEDDDLTVVIINDDLTVVDMTESPDFIVSLEGIPGPPGPSSAGAGQPRFTGEGVPGTIIGASPGDEYLDNLTGTIYRLV